ncbi:hypothetical protein RYX36_036687 [Vicia faba]
MSKEEFQRLFNEFEEFDFERTGGIATKKVELKEGPLDIFTQEMEPFLRKQGMPVRLNTGAAVTIGVVVSLIVLCLLGITVCFVQKKEKGKGSRSDYAAPSPYTSSHNSGQYLALSKILRIGQLVILSVPGEFTTMAGRRLRDAVKTVLSGDKSFVSNIHVVIAWLNNTYSQYVTIYEEYENMRNKKLKEFRDELKATSRFFLGSNKVMQVALGRSASDEIKPNLHKVSKLLRGDAGMVFTNMSKEEFQRLFNEFEEFDFARTGGIATKKVELKEGPLDIFTHEMEPFLRKQGMPVRLNTGAAVTIGVVVSLIVLSLLGITVCFVQKKEKGKRIQI